MLQIDPLDQPLRGIPEIARFINENEQIVRRLLNKKAIAADKDGRLWFTTPRRILASPYIAGRKAATA